MGKRILITGPFDEEVLNDLKGRGFQVTSLPANVSQAELMAAIRDANGYVLGGNETLTEDVVNQAANLKVIVFLGEQPETFMGAGVKGILENRGILLESTPGVSTNAVAEMACALILCALRRIPYLVGQVQAYQWPSCTGDELAGKTIGIYGMGKIGYTVVKRFGGFEPNRVLYSDIVRSEYAEKDFGAQRVEMEQLFSESDVVSIHAPLTDKTKGIVGEELLRRMKPTSVLVNTARPDIVDPNALRKVLEEGAISCAAFDGYYIEGSEFMNLASNDPYGLLRLHDRFFVTSHQGFNTREAIESASETSSGKIISFFGSLQQSCSPL